MNHRRRASSSEVETCPYHPARGPAWGRRRRRRCRIASVLLGVVFAAVGTSSPDRTQPQIRAEGVVVEVADRAQVQQQVSPLFVRPLLSSLHL